MTDPPPHSGRRSGAIDGLHVVTLCAFAVAQPTFDLLGRNASFFVAHRSSRGDVILLAAAVLVVVPTALLIARAGISALSARAGRVFHLAAVGLLIALATVPPAARALPLRWFVVVPIAGAIGTGGAVAYSRLAVVRRFLTVLAPAVVLFPALFLFGSQVRDLVLSPAIAEPATAGATQRSDVPVMVVLFDELSMSSLITPQGEIDGVRYPNFARLAHRSTWYPNATTSGLRTDQAVPAVLTGRRVPRRQIPSSFTYPQSAFTLMSKTHDLHVQEFVTQLCPPNLCRSSDRDQTQGLGPLFGDTAIVYGHIVLPSDVSGRLLPPLGDRWAGFSRDTEQGGGGSDPVSAWLRAAIDERETRHEGAIFERFLRSVGPATDGRPPFAWLHAQIPHPPWRYLPNGQTYPPGSDTPGYRNFRWGPDQYLADEVLQRSLLQTAFTDVLVGRLLDHLDDEGLFDDMMLAVISDHGATWERSSTRREVDGSQGGALLGVPLFVKYPGQTAGTVDDRRAELVDLLPTIADVSGIDIPWDTHGFSLRGKKVHTDRRVFDGTDERIVRYSFQDARRRAAQIEGLFGKSGGRDDLFAFGRYAPLLGRSTRDDFSIGIASAPITASFDAVSFRNLDKSSGSLPAFFRAALSERVGAGKPVAVALNGRIAGVGQTYDEDGASRIAMMLAPRYMRDGRNEVRLFWIVDAGELVLLPKT